MGSKHPADPLPVLGRFLSTGRRGETASIHDRLCDSACPELPDLWPQHFLVDGIGHRSRFDFPLDELPAGPCGFLRIAVAADVHGRILYAPAQYHSAVWNGKTIHPANRPASVGAGTIGLP